jgi:hypothetical protein
MDPKNSNNHKIAQFLSSMPGKIVSLHGRENIPEFVLHDLSGKSCFNFSKASYFVDNPDFDHLKGVAGYITTQAFEHSDAIWDNPDLFTRHMQGAPFNKQVRTIMRPSPKRGCLQAQTIVDIVAQELEMNNPQFFCWNMKHYNHGLFIYENYNGHTEWEPEDLMNGLHLLSLCPVF